MAEREPHEILGVARDASEEEVRAAYRKMVKKHHPDVSDAEDAEERFVDIRDAYEVMRERAGKETEGKSTGSEKAEKKPGRSKNGRAGPKAGAGTETKTGTRTSTRSEHKRRRREKRKRWNDPWETETETDGRNNEEKDEDKKRKERVGGLGYGWTLFREDERFYVSKESGRGRVYIGDEGKTRSQKSIFSSRSEAEEAYEKHVERRKERRTTISLGDDWRLVGRTGGYAVEGKQGQGYLGIDGSLQDEPYWFRSREEAENIYEFHVGEKDEGEQEESDSLASRVTVGAALIPFLATVTLLNVISSSLGLGAKGRNPYLATALTSAFFGTLSVFLKGSYPLLSFILLSLAVWAGVEFTVMVAGPYTADEIEGQQRI